MHHTMNRAALLRKCMLLGLVMALIGGFGVSGSQSSAAGSTWTLLPDPFKSNYAKSIWVLGVAPNGFIYAGGSGGVSVSTNGGQSWAVINNGLTNLQVAAIGFNSLGEPVVGVGYKTNVPIDVLRYTQGSWHKATGISATRNIAAFTRDRTGALLAVTGWAGDVFRSTDNGNNFTKIAGTVGSTNGITVGALFAVDALSDGSLYTGGEMAAGIYRSTDNGATWLNDGLSKTQGYTGNITAMTHNVLNEVLAARTSSSTGAPLQRRVNSQWVSSSTGIPAWHTVFGLVLSPNHDLYVDVTGQAQYEGVYRSTDNGLTWTRDFACTAFRAMGNMAVDQAGSVYVVAKPAGSTLPYGVYKR